jgi:dethiobiotin synthetase
MNRNRLLICGIGTDVGKTLVSAILVEALKAHYWKPVQAGHLESSDSKTVKNLVPNTHCYPETYLLKHPLSPHLAAALEGIELQRDQFQIPSPPCPLVIESTGGILVPLNHNVLLIDLFMEWECEWILVSRHYVGSINHSLLTIEALQKRKIKLRGIIFNGTNQPFTEDVVLSYSGLSCLGHLYPEEVWTPDLIKRYAQQWKTQI